jgi:5-methyltetrahydrofolate--homocysteine methyltransferase
MLDGIVAEGSLRAAAVYGFFASNSDGDDIVVYADESRSTELARFCTLRQQRAGRSGSACLALADYIAPLESGVADYLGAFALTAGIGVDALAGRYEAEHDDYNAIMVKALADRLAEAFAERLHQLARIQWGYGKEENLEPAELIKERYRGIRPAAGYPACPDHSEKHTLFDLLAVERETGITLTESCAMVPTAAVSGLYFAHPESRYFSVGRVGRDQVQDYARRKQQPRQTVERWLSPYLAYDPETD